VDGRAPGKVVGYADWNKALTFFNGTAAAPAQQSPGRIAHSRTARASIARAVVPGPFPVDVAAGSQPLTQ
jgi:hypothetical protein